MQITSSYSVEIRKQDLCFRKTFEVYRSAAAYLIPVFDSVWEELEETGSAKRRFNAAEHLVHSTKKNTACFDFDLRFPKMPSDSVLIPHPAGSVEKGSPLSGRWGQGCLRKDRERASCTAGREPCHAGVLP